jgi:hypothetical protein
MSKGSSVTHCGIDEKVRFVVVVLILSSPRILLVVNLPKREADYIQRCSVGFKNGCMCAPAPPFVVTE